MVYLIGMLKNLETCQHEFVTQLNEGDRTLKIKDKYTTEGSFLEPQEVST